MEAASKFIMDQSISSPAASHNRAKTSASPENAKESTVSGADYGRSMPDSFAIYDRDLQFWKTSQLCLFQQNSDSQPQLQEFWGTWPRAGTMRNGIVYPHAPLVPLMRGIGSGLLPTPLENHFPAAAKKVFLPTLGRSEYKGSSRVRFKGSPHFRGAKMSEGLRICEEDPTYLNPSFAELVMGFPIGWTVLPLAETLSSPK